MQYEVSYEKLLYQYEVLRTRIEIREHYLGTVVKEVYENIGQMLSLIRVKLSILRQDFEVGRGETIDSSGEMVGKTINDLRSMCKLFYPEEEIMNGTGLYKVIDDEIKIKFPRAVCQVDERSLIGLNGEKGLIVFGILLEMIMLVDKQQGAGISLLHISRAGNKIVFTIEYYGELALEKRNRKGPGDLDLDVFERAKLFGGRLQIKNKEHHSRKIKLEVPIN